MDDKLVDFQSIRAFSGGDPGLMKMHISTFLDFAPSQLQQIRAKSAEKDWQEVKNLAHKLKPKLSYMGIKAAIPLIEKIESSAENPMDEAQLTVMISEMDAMVQKAILELKDFMNS